jgi:hypothetical protein
VKPKLGGHAATYVRENRVTFKGRTEKLAKRILPNTNCTNIPITSLRA